MNKSFDWLHYFPSTPLKFSIFLQEFGISPRILKYSFSGIFLEKHRPLQKVTGPRFKIVPPFHKTIGPRFKIIAPREKTVPPLLKTAAPHGKIPGPHRKVGAPFPKITGQRGKNVGPPVGMV